MDNTRHISHRRQIGGEVSTSSSSRAQAIADQYSVDKPVTVYYDPNDPKSAVLITGASSSGLVLLIIGIVFIFAAFVCTPFSGLVSGFLIR